MSEPEPRDQSVPEGLEGYPYASDRAERTIRTVTTVMSVCATLLLLAGLYFALFTPNVLAGGVMSLLGFVDLMLVPYIAKQMRRQAIAREGRPRP